jgi:membrane protease YdiL (CAAX protease family)
MMAYPTPAQLLRVSLPALLIAHFLVWPLIGLRSSHAGLIAAELVIVWFMALFMRRQRMIPENLLLLNAVPPSSLVIVAATAFFASLAIAEFDLLWGQVLALIDLEPPLSLQRGLLEIQIVRTPLEMILGLLAVAAFPGVCEELFFRGFVFTGLCAHRSPTTALLGSALLFALAHFNPWQLPALLLFGLFLGLLVYWTHSIYPAILAHVVNNLVSFAGTNLRAYFGLEFFTPFQPLPLPFTATAVLLLIAGLLLLRRQPAVVELIDGQTGLPESEVVRFKDKYSN